MSIEELLRHLPRGWYNTVTSGTSAFTVMTVLREDTEKLADSANEHQLRRMVEALCLAVGQADFQMRQVTEVVALRTVEIDSHSKDPGEQAETLERMLDDALRRLRIAHRELGEERSKGLLGKVRRVVRHVRKEWLKT